MIDPLIALAFAIQSHKGAYALLLGSGVSRAAEIPTGWEIVLDLIRKLAHVEGETLQSSPEEWYRSKYGRQPDYSELLEQVAGTPDERQKLLAGYFEPTPEERDDGLKQPTAAHKAIAKLVAQGFVRVVVTTNFDHLIERAIESEGVTPTVISTPESIEGMKPLVHQQRVVIKVHGDYLDSRIKNTPEELGNYDERLNRLLDQVLDEFGIVICGWSGVWDTALLKAFQRCKSRRFTTFWAAKDNQIADSAQQLLQSRAGQVIAIRDADSFFSDLTEKVLSLDDLQRPHPHSVAAVTATVKRFLADDRYRIQFDDLVCQETERVIETLHKIVSDAPGFDFPENLNRVVAALELIRPIALHGIYWGEQHHIDRLIQIAPRFANEPKPGTKPPYQLDELRAIAAIIVFYTQGIVAIARDRYDIVAALFGKTMVSTEGKRQRLVAAIHWDYLENHFKTVVPDQNRSTVAVSDWLFGECRVSCRTAVSDDAQYDEVFDRFEAVRTLVNAEIETRGKSLDRHEVWAPPGRYWRQRYWGRNVLQEQVANTQLTEALCNAGLFPSWQRFAEIAAAVSKRFGFGWAT